MSQQTPHRYVDERTPTQVLAQTLKRLYPQNPDIVLGREARTIIEAFTEAGFAVVARGCLHVFDPCCARCKTLRAFMPWEDTDG